MWGEVICFVVLSLPLPLPLPLSKDVRIMIQWKKTIYLEPNNSELDFLRTI